MNNVIALNNENFESVVLKNEKPVLLDFWASWCGPCKMIAPIVEELAHDYEGKITVGKVNVDEQPELAAAFRVSSIPTIVVMKKGQVTNVAVGYRSKSDLEALLA